MKKTFSILLIAVILCLSGCSPRAPKNLLPISDDDERLVVYYNDAYNGIKEEKQLLLKNAPAAVYTGEYETFSIPAELNILSVSCVVGDGRFLVLRALDKKDEYGSTMLEYGIYSSDGSYQRLFDNVDEFISAVGKDKLLFLKGHSFGTDDRYSEGYPEFAVYSLDGSLYKKVSAESEDELLLITHYNEDYIVYIVKKEDGIKYKLEQEVCEMHLLSLDDLSDKTVCRFSHAKPYFGHRSVILDNALYYEAITGERTISFGKNPILYSVMRYDIDSGKSTEILGNIGFSDTSRMTSDFSAYKDKAVYVNGSDKLMCIDGNNVSELYDLTDCGPAENRRMNIFQDIFLYKFVPDDYNENKTVNYLKDGEPFPIIEGSGVDFERLGVSGGYVVWDLLFCNECLPMLYDIENNVVVFFDDIKSEYHNMVFNDKIYFINPRKYNPDTNEYEGEIRILAIDTDKI